MKLPSHRRLLPLLLALFTLSGSSGLIYQIAWLKFLNLAFGVTIYAVSTVLAGFMAGLALGSFAGGRVADRAARPLRLYGLLELAIGGLGLLSPTLFLWLQEAYRWLHPLLPEDLLSVSLGRFALAFTLLIIPTSLMGATLPIAVKSPLVAEAGLGRGMSLLYAFNTFGAMAGTLAAGFFLIGGVGLRGTILVAAAINLIAGLGAIALDLLAARAPTKAVPLSHPKARPSPEDEADPRRSVLLVVLVVFGLSGFCSLAYEVVWTRILTFFSDGTTYAFTLMLAAFLLGIALGSYIINPFINRRLAWLPILAALEFGIGLTSLLSARVVGEIYPVLKSLSSLPLLGWLILNETRVLAAAIAFTILPTTLLLGVAFPIGLRIFSGGATRVGYRVGTLYAANVFGSILGSFAAGFVLVPLLGSQRSLTLLALANWLMVPLLLGGPSGKSLRLPGQGERGLGTPQTPPCRGAIDRAPTPWTRFSRLVAVLATGSLMLLLAASSPEMYGRVFESRFPNDQLLWREEGLENTVSVHRNREGLLIMYLDGRHQASTYEPALLVHRLIGHLPLLLHPNPQEVLVIGLGGGATAGAIAQHPLRQIEVVELSESIVRAADLFSEANYDVLRQPNLRLRVDDGRNFLLLTDRRYDVIAADVIQPHQVGSGNLYSEEYYRMARNALRPGGLMVQWVGGFNPATNRLIVRTFLSVFPYATLWSEGPILIGALEPSRLDLAIVRKKFADPRTRAALAATGINSEEDLLRLYAGNRDDLLRFVGSGPLSTDNQPFNEYFRSLPPGERSPRADQEEQNIARHIRGNLADLLAH